MAAMTSLTKTAEPIGASFASTLPQRIILADGWARRAIAFGAGAVGALALSPLNFAPAMFVTLCTAVWLIDGSAQAVGSGASRFAPVASCRSAAGAGWWLGFGYFFAGLWWLGAAMLVEADQFAWALPLAVLGLPAVLALFTALGFALAQLLWTPSSMRIFALAAGLGASEWLRGHILTGFPWNDFGMAMASLPILAQSASLFGLYGLDLIAIAAFAAPATLVDAPPRRLPTAPVKLTPSFVSVIVAVCALAGYGALRLNSHETGYVDGVRLRLMQPNLPQDAKFNPENGPEILRHYLALSDQATAPDRTGVADVTHLIWPESAFPFVLSREPRALASIERALQGKILITGAARAEDGRSGGGEKGRTKIFNSIEVLHGGKIVAFYDKTHLVPFGEYLPLARILNPLGVSHLVPGVWDVGAGPRRLVAPGLPAMAPLICYEAIFPGDATPKNGERPQFLLNLTNDGWFGKTSGPYQHFAQARLRAIEEGLPLVRVANTGISAIVDPFGRILNELPLGAEGIIDGRLPKAAKPTLFANYTGLGFLSLWLFSIILAIIGHIRA
jgi:apolipoprotein N-acyltransferase